MIRGKTGGDSVKTVKIINETGDSTRTQVVDAETGATIHGVTEVRIRIALDDSVRAEIDLLAVMVTLSAVPTFMVTDPDTGEHKAVGEIHFADGTKWSALVDETTLADTVRKHARR